MSSQTTAPPQRIRLSRRLTHRVIVGVRGLLPMLYRPPELCAMFGIKPSTVKDWIRNGLDHERDARGHIWINGHTLAEWVELVRRTRARQPLAPGQAYCRRCRQPVPLLNPTEHIEHKKRLLRGTCPQCGHGIYRGGRHDQS